MLLSWWKGRGGLVEVGGGGAVVAARRRRRRGGRCACPIRTMPRKGHEQSLITTRPTTAKMAAARARSAHARERGEGQGWCQNSVQEARCTVVDGRLLVHIAVQDG